MAKIKERYDGLVIGAGIAGMQAALDLAGQGFDVLVVERQPSIGGVMVGLNKVFPTLDCSSCICTPRMAEVAHHPRITILTYSDVQRVEPLRPGFWVQILKKPRYVVEDQCIGCSLCELACEVLVPHEFECGLGARRAIYIPHANAIPQVAVLDPEYCVFDGSCAKVCPKDCIDFAQLPEERAVEAGTVIVTSGLQITPMNAKKEYGGDTYVNVMNPLAMERVEALGVPRRIVAFVIPTQANDMHDGTSPDNITQADTWLQSNLGVYATWATTHNSLLIVTWDLGDATPFSYSPQIPVISNTTVYTDTGLSCSTPYYYRVRAYSALGASGCTSTTSTGSRPTSSPRRATPPREPSSGRTRSRALTSTRARACSSSRPRARRR